MLPWHWPSRLRSSHAAVLILRMKGRQRREAARRPAWLLRTTRSRGRGPQSLHPSSNIKPRSRPASSPTPSHEEIFYGKGPVTVVLTLQDGQLLISSSLEEGEPLDDQWAGAYEIVDEDTFVAGDTGDLYIEYTYSIDGDQLVIDMVRDDYPTVSEEVLAGEIYAQTVIYESVPFTREA